ncbi:hypothetical protein Rs2_24279 [Raphanus sativus]|nr:hypothetical protein Rs2_24279 [Raphanus sativus]
MYFFYAVKPISLPPSHTRQTLIAKDDLHSRLRSRFTFAMMSSHQDHPRFPLTLLQWRYSSTFPTSFHSHLPDVILLRPTNPRVSTVLAPTSIPWKKTLCISRVVSILEEAIRLTSFLMRHCLLDSLSQSPRSSSGSLANSDTHFTYTIGEVRGIKTLYNQATRALNTSSQP